jgi:hypothetical protein
MDNRRRFDTASTAGDNSLHLYLPMLFVVVVAPAIGARSSALALTLHGGRSDRLCDRCCMNARPWHAHDLIRHAIGFLLKSISRRIDRQLWLDDSWPPERRVGFTSSPGCLVALRSCPQQTQRRLVSNGAAQAQARMFQLTLRRCARPQGRRGRWCTLRNPIRT